MLIKTINKHDDKGDNRDSHDEDGGGDERGGIETSLTVGVLPLSLVHLPSAVLTTSTHTETCAYDGGEDHKQDADGRTDEEASLIVNPLQGEKIYLIIISLFGSHKVSFGTL